MIDLDTLYGILIIAGAIALVAFVAYHQGKVPDGGVVGKRARKQNGRFVADNPKTYDWNEAYIGGKRPRNPRKKPKIKLD